LSGRFATRAVTGIGWIFGAQDSLRAGHIHGVLTLDQEKFYSFDGTEVPLNLLDFLLLRLLNEVRQQLQDVDANEMLVAYKPVLAVDQNSVRFATGFGAFDDSELISFTPSVGSAVPKNIWILFWKCRLRLPHMLVVWAILEHHILPPPAIAKSTAILGLALAIFHLMDHRERISPIDMRKFVRKDAERMIRANFARLESGGFPIPYQ
jgi:hypothetical protein